MRLPLTFMTRRLIVMLLLGASPGYPLTHTQNQTEPPQSPEKAMMAKGAAEDANRLSNEGSAESFRAAIAKYAEALRLYREIGDRRNEAATLNNIGAIYDALDEMQKALDAYSQALPLRRVAGDRKGEALTLIALGRVYNNLGEKQKALAYYNQAAPIVRELADDSLAVRLSSSVGSLYKSVGSMQEALKYHTLALSLSRKLGDRKSEAGALSNIGAVYSSVGQSQKALDYSNQALLLYRALGDRSSEAITLNNIGAVYYTLGEPDRAVEYYNQALPVRRALGDRSGEADTLGNLMEVWTFRKSPAPALAVFYGKQAVNVLQQLRENITGLDKEVQKTFLKTKAVFYRGLAYLLMALGRLPEAQQALNLFKDQQFFDFNRETRKQAAPLTLTPHEALTSERYEQTTNRLELIGQRLAELKLNLRGRQPGAEEAVRLQQLEAQLKTTSDEFMVFLKQVETEFARADSESDKVKEIADTRALQSTLRELGRQTGQKAVAVYTFVGGDRFCALVLSADNITVASQPVNGAALNQKALQLWGLLQSDKYDPRPLAQELYAVIFKAIESQLPAGTNTILWSLDGNLRYLPMAALYDGRQYLAERYNCVVFTRADSERLLRAVSPRWTGLGLGSSQAHTIDLGGEKLTFNALPGVTEELRTLFRQKGSSNGVLDGEVLPDASFTKTAMLAALKQKRPLVHISSHFSFRPGDEGRSFLLLGDGTAMTLEEMKQQADMFAGVELLTLSACNTAAQQAGANGREIDGFAELAQRLGAGSVMATLWPVADNSTPWLMREFYQTLQSGKGLSKAEAFRRAQLALLSGTAQTRALPEGLKGAPAAVQIVITADGNKPTGAPTRGPTVYVAEKDALLFKRDEKRPFAHPYYWAPFILIGNSK
jgi:CHAT domain-containing protein